MNILVTGGAGYIGSNTCVELLLSGHQVVIVDNLCNSHEGAIADIEALSGKKVGFYEADICKSDPLREIFNVESIDAVMHFAGLKAVGESVAKPLLYYQNNLAGTLNLLQAMEEADVRRLVFSSSATVYGDPARVPIREDFPRSATNPYGMSKLMQEYIMEDLCRAGGWSIVFLRYFNPVGAHKSGLLGENPGGIPNNLMPYIVGAADGSLPALSVFGGDYPTPDGTGVRDYMHVTDLAKGHLAALSATQHGDPGLYIYNLGTGEGTSVLEMISVFEQTNGVKVPFVLGARRPGDIAICYGDVEKAGRELGWRTERNLADMCRDAWNAKRKNQ